MNDRVKFVELAQKRNPFVQVSVWRGWANEILDIFAAEGYRLKHVTHRMDGDKSYTQDVVYDFVFELPKPVGSSSGVTV